MNELKDKVAIVTGASRGIGAATAREFARLGAKVVLTARSAAIDILTQPAAPHRLSSAADRTLYLSETAPPSVSRLRTLA